MKIRKATLKDLPEILRLCLAFKQEEALFEPYYLSLRENAKNIIKKHVKKMIQGKNSFILLAVEGDKVIGFLEGEGKKEFLPFYKQRNRGYIQELYITKGFRRKGIGKKLMNSAREKFKAMDLNIMDLDVVSKNKEAIEFYKKMGFKEFSKFFRKVI